MRIDRAHATIAINVVAAEQDIPHPEAELAVGVPRREPDLEFELADLDDVLDELGSRKEVEYAYTILSEGTSADRQLAT